MIITANGEYVLKTGLVGSNSTSTNVMVSGTLGTAVLDIGYYDDFGSFIGFTDASAIEVGTQHQVAHGQGVVPVLRVTSAGGTNISVVVTGLE